MLGLSRRALVVLVSAALMLALAAAGIGGLVAATQSEGGREWIRGVVEAQLARAIGGRVHLGTLRGSFLTDLQVDSVRLADANDSVFVATGPVRITFDPRDLADGRLIFRSAEVQRPFVALRREPDGTWTHEKLFPRRRSVGRTFRKRSAFGAVFVLEQASVREGLVALRLPGREAGGGRRVTREWRWENIAVDVPRARFAYPDSSGMRFDIARLDADESNPPFAFRDVRGTLLLQRDTLRTELTHFALPGSSGRAVGRVTWGGGEGARYAFRIEGDSVALADVAWINPAIPTEGGGRMRLDIRNNPRDRQLVEYVITQMDVVTHRSRLKGQMTWGVKDADVALRNVDLEMAPLDAELIARFNQGPLPIPLRGRLVGRVRGPGGPLDDFVVEDATATFYDGNVPGATAVARARGRLDISEPAYPVFYGVRLDLGRFDLRTAQALEPSLPKLNGILSGSARLDSVWGDLRIADADLTLVDGDAPASRLRGRVRTTWDAASPLRWDLDAVALPLSLTALSRSFPALKLQGEYEGPLRSVGTSDDLTVTTSLDGPAGGLDADVRVDNALPYYRVVGRVDARALDPSLLLSDSRAPAGEVSGRAAADLGWETLADLAGTLDVDLQRSTLEGVRIFAGSTRLTFGDGLARVDTLALETSALDVSAGGGLGLAEGETDTLRVRIRMDSLGGLRPLLDRPVGDSLAGALLLDARLTGWVRNFAADVTAGARGVFYAGSTAEDLQAQAALRGFPEAPSGRVVVVGDTLSTGGFRLRRAGLEADLAGRDPARIALRATGAAGTQLGAQGRIARAGDSTTVRLDSLSLLTARHAWRLLSPGAVHIAEGGFVADELTLATGRDARVQLRGGLPRQGTLDLSLDGRAIPMADVAELLQLTALDSGTVDVQARFAGTRAAPELSAEGELRSALLRGVRLDTVRTRLVALRDGLDLRASLGSRQRPSLTAEARLPLRLDLEGDATGLEEDGPVSGRIVADALDLGIFERWTRGVGTARGTMQLDVALGGTWARPTADGLLRVRNGSLAPEALGQVRWRAVEADVAFLGDSIALRTLSAQSVVAGAARNGRASIGGWVALADRRNPRMDLRVTSREFNVFSKPGTADIDMSGELRIAGAFERATLSGALTADRAIIGIPELATKDVISLEGPDRFGVADTIVLAEGDGLAAAPPAFVENLTVADVPITMGQNVWIRSSEANINLGGQVRVTRGRITRGPNAGQVQLAVTGPLQTVRGTYRLNLGPVQRTFTVEQGEIRFFGDPELNPSLNIAALHTVRQYSQQGVRPDVRVRVQLGGTLRQPTAELSTPDSMRVTNADLISYLVTGGPSYEIARDGNVSATAARVLLGSFGAVLGGKVAGGLCDDAQLTTAGLDAYQGRLRDVGGGILSGSRFNCAKQVGDRAFVRLDAGLCGVGQLVQNGGGALSLGDALGLKLDYLLGRGFSASFGVEPPTSATLCSTNASTSARGFVPTPRQVGVDLFRAWRF